MGRFDIGGTNPLDLADLDLVLGYFVGPVTWIARLGGWFCGETCTGEKNALGIHTSGY